MRSSTVRPTVVAVGNTGAAGGFGDGRLMRGRYEEPLELRRDGGTVTSVTAQPTPTMTLPDPVNSRTNNSHRVTCSGALPTPARSQTVSGDYNVEGNGLPETYWSVPSGDLRVRTHPNNVRPQSVPVLPGSTVQRNKAFAGKQQPKGGGSTDVDRREPVLQ